MKLLVFSDVHGNGYAFDAFIENIQQEEYDRIVFCGDIFGYYYDQKRIIEQLSQMKNLLWIKGNHDNYFYELYDDDADEEKYILKYGSTYSGIQERFSENEYHRISRLPDCLEMTIDQKKVGVFHGTPYDPLNGRLYPDTEIKEGSLYEKYDIVILGHTHCRMMRRYKDTLIVNSGSLGQPRDGNTFGYAIIDTKCLEVTFYDLFFDCSELYQQIKNRDPDLDKLIQVLERRKNK